MGLFGPSKINCKCPECGYEITVKFKDMNKNGYPKCPKCGRHMIPSH